MLNWKVFSRGGLRSRFRSASTVGGENVNLGAPVESMAERAGPYRGEAKQGTIFFQVNTYRRSIETGLCDVL